MAGTAVLIFVLEYLHQFIIILAHIVYDITIDVNIEFPQHCDTSDKQFTQLNEDYN